MPAPKKAAPDKPKRKKSVVVQLSERELVVAEAVLDGKTIKAAAEEAGCTPQNASHIVRKSEDVKTYIEEHRSELRNVAQIQRADLIAGFMEAIDVARLAADPGSMIRGWTEIGKVLGLYAPEKKVVEVNPNQKLIRSKFEIMSDEELLQIAEQKVTVIDGECKTIQ